MYGGWSYWYVELLPGGTSGMRNFRYVKLLTYEAIGIWCSLYYVKLSTCGISGM